MTDRSSDAQRPLEETPEVAAAVEQETSVNKLTGGGGPGPDNPDFREAGDTAEFPPTEEILGAPFGGGTPAARGARTGAEQPWDPEDLVMAQGGEPTPERVRRAQAELDRDGPAAIERTVP
ncbi:MULTISPECIES: hypothetical protein [Polymorphospora]|uniref:DUF5709 domain-containing protein n=1 Tax=Polymorphospora lycopeni TaxID=3140240 RepID=A0ABV5CNM5_9ACTN